MAITAALVKQLRDRTGLGMMDCKKALQETDGDLEKAIDELRKSSALKAAKKAGRTAADGKISILVGSDGPLGLTRDGSNTDSMTFTLDDTVVTVGNFTYEAGDPSSTVGGAGSAPSAGSMKITEFENEGFILEVDDSFSDGSDATNFFNEITGYFTNKS